MKTRYFFAVFGFALFHVTSANVCANPEITSVSYTTQDATIVTNIAFISEFTFKCPEGISGLPLYAEVSRHIFPAVHVGKNKYQISWTEEIGRSRSGDYSVHLFDEEGYGSLRKAIRNGEYLSSVKPLATITVHHPGTYQGPWVNSEFMAAVLAALVWYLAFSAKSKLLL